VISLVMFLLQIDLLKKKLEKRRVKISKVTDR